MLSLISTLTYIYKIGLLPLRILLLNTFQGWNPIHFKFNVDSLKKDNTDRYVMELSTFPYKVKKYFWIVTSINFQSTSQT